MDLYAFRNSLLQYKKEGGGNKNKQHRTQKGYHLEQLLDEGHDLYQLLDKEIGSDLNSGFNTA